MKITGNPSLLQLLQSQGDTARAQPSAQRDDRAENALKGRKPANGGAKNFEALPLRQADNTSQAKTFAREAPLAGRAPKYVAPGQNLNILV